MWWIVLILVLGAGAYWWVFARKGPVLPTFLGGSGGGTEDEEQPKGDGSVSPKDKGPRQS